MRIGEGVSAGYLLNAWKNIMTRWDLRFNYCKMIILISVLIETVSLNKT